MIQNGSILFRRTLAVVGALTLGATAVPAFGATATLGTASCQHSGISVDPAGNVTVNCVSTSPTVATFALSGPPSLAVGGAAGNATINRIGGPDGDIHVAYSVTGACSATPQSGAIVFGAPGAKTIALTPGTTAGTCTVAIMPAAPHLASPGSVNVSVGGGSTGGGIPGCPAPQPDHKVVSMGWTGDYVELRMTSGEIAAFPIPAPKPTSTKVTVRLMQGQQPASPASATTEFYISKCPGVIDSSSQFCYKSTVASNFIIAQDAWTAAKYNFTNQATIGGRGCWAPRAEGQWYVNVRWTYAGSCPFGCGYSMQWSEGSY